MTKYKKKRTKENPYKQTKVYNALKHEHLPQYMWTRAKFTKEIKRINPNIDCSIVSLGVLKEVFLLYKEDYNTPYKAIYFFGLNKEYIKQLTQDDVYNLSLETVESCQRLLPKQW